jgi:parallel beta-helix repeat protein
MTRHTLLSTGTPLLVAAGAVFALGDLNPPAGSVTATGKRLTELEPRIAVNATNTPGDATALFVISQPGSYYLTERVSGVSGKCGIKIAVNEVTLDLGGFELVGGVGSTQGILISGIRASVRIRNGSIVGWSSEGVAGVSDNSAFEDLVLRNNGSWGINGRDSFALRIEGCTAFSNGFNISATGGIIGGRHASLIVNCSSALNFGDGIYADTGSSVIDSVSSRNTASGFLLTTNCTLVDSNAYGNNGNGILCTSDCVVRGNLASDNGFGSGIAANIYVVGSDNRVEDNSCNTADKGIEVDGTGNVILRNTCSGNTTNWDIVAGNALAPIVSATTNAAAVLGGTYAGSLGSTDANANFTY